MTYGYEFMPDDHKITLDALRTGEAPPRSTTTGNKDTSSSHHHNGNYTTISLSAICPSSDEEENTFQIDYLIPAYLSFNREEAGAHTQEVRVLALMDPGAVGDYDYSGCSHTRFIRSTIAYSL